MTPPRSLLAVLAALALAGCGRDRLAVPDPETPSSNGAKATVAYPKAGVSFRAPADWSFGDGQAPLVTSTANGSATIAVWRYLRSEELPRERAALKAARTNLLNATRGRDPSFKESKVRWVEVDGAPGIQIVGDETVAGRPRRVRSTHVYAKGAEYVIDQYAAPDVFRLVDGLVFKPLLTSLKIDPPQG